ncbi:rod shape-determining protein MreD [Fictibacillus sp. Mic-4]|uniref:rod shape-determining protein MreD n=1 Tax=Fictibacillus sp. Mic-4 TaxID=3132826 RepID=UPI003CE7C3F8
MYRILLPFLTYIAFVFESTVMQVVNPKQDWGILLIPHFSLVIIIFVASYLKPSYGIVYGLIFGLLTDLMYTDLIGIYMFSTALVAYITAVLSRFLFGNLFVTLVLTILGVAVLEFLVYGLNTLVGVANESVDLFLYNRLISTLILNGVFAILIYYPLLKFLRKMKDSIGEN